MIFHYKIRLICFSIVFVCFFVSSPANAARYWCHDYTLQFVDGRQTVGIGVNVLRKALSSKCSPYRYVKSTYPDIADLKKIEVIPGDVIIITEMHSGVFTTGRKINHFFGETYKDVDVKSWTIQQFHDFSRTKNPQTGKPIGKTTHPFRNRPVQLWKKIKAKTTLSKIVISPDIKNVKIGEKVLFDAVALYSDGKKAKITDDASWNPGKEFIATQPGSFSITATCRGVTGTVNVTVKDEITYYLTLTEILARINGVPCSTKVFHCVQSTKGDLNWIFNIHRKIFNQGKSAGDANSADTKDCVKTQAILDIKQSIAQGPSSRPITVPRPSTNCPCADMPAARYQLKQEYEPRCATYDELKQMKQLLMEMK